MWFTRFRNVEGKIENLFAADKVFQSSTYLLVLISSTRKSSLSSFHPKLATRLEL